MTSSHRNYIYRRVPSTSNKQHTEWGMDGNAFLGPACYILRIKVGMQLLLTYVAAVNSIAFIIYNVKCLLHAIAVYAAYVRLCKMISP